AREPRLDHPDVALMREHDALRRPGRARGVEKHRGLARTRHDGVERSAVEKTIEAAGSLVAEMHGWNIRRTVARTRHVAEHELRDGIPQDEMNSRTGKLETDRHRDETSAHDAVIGREIFRAVGGEDGHPFSARQAARAKRAGDAACHGVELGMADLARELAAEIDDGDLVEIMVAPDEVAEIGEARHDAALRCARDTHRSSLRRRGEVGAAAAGDELALRIEHLRLRGRELAAHPHDLAADSEIPGHGHGVIVDVQVDGGHAAAGLLDHGPVAAEIDQRGENPAVSIAPVRIDYPLLPPRRLQFDTVVVKRNDLQTEPLMIRGAGDERLHALERDIFAHGTTTTLPMTSRSWIRRNPARAWASGSTLSITGRILRFAMSVIRARRSSS